VAETPGEADGLLAGHALPGFLEGGDREGGGECEGCSRRRF
jgi:hypothetical protein